MLIKPLKHLFVANCLNGLLPAFCTGQVGVCKSANLQRMCIRHLICHFGQNKVKLFLLTLFLSFCCIFYASYLVLWTLLFFNVSLYNIGLFLWVILLFCWELFCLFLFFVSIHVSFFISLQWWRTASADERDSAQSFSAALLVIWIWISLCHSAPQICHSTLQWRAACYLCVYLSTGVCMEVCMVDF